MTFLVVDPADPLYFDIAAAKDLGRDLAEEYANADPFPHIVIDDFLPEEIIDYCLQHFPDRLDPEGRVFERDQERFKKSYQPDHLEPRLRGLFYAFNSRPFIKIVEHITGISGLVPDPYFLGGGFHEISTGGHLSIHADFNRHAPMGLERRVNVLIYLNRDWKDEYGGQLELWTTDMKRKARSVVPLANRCVMFTTTGQSMHGNPVPVAHPDGRSRKSIALYYYTSTWSSEQVHKNTQFRPRAGTQDRVDWAVRTQEALREYLPPAVYRRVIGLVKRAFRQEGRRVAEGQEDN
jgi:Rps23 Pro-64 3,4-dihydroxylase Tpa1-like proline 4-hydroxylase